MKFGWGILGNSENGNGSLIWEPDSCSPVLVRLSILYGPIEMIPIPLFILVRKFWV